MIRGSGWIMQAPIQSFERDRWNMATFAVGARPEIRDRLALYDSHVNQ